MPSVAEELEALRKANLTKNFAEKLKDADGLSTPEAEEEVIDVRAQVACSTVERLLED